MVAAEPTPGSPVPPARPIDSLSLVEELIDGALTALRQGTLELLVRQRPRITRWAMRRFLPIMRGAAADMRELEAGPADMPALLLRWLVTQLRPDLEPRLDGIDDEAWLNRVSWRPMLALMCHVRLAQVPAFPGRYRKRADEAAVDNLCGLWDVGPSTFYRYVERGKHLMAAVATESPLSVPRRLSLRRFVATELEQRHVWPDANERTAWHRKQVALLGQRGDPASALWHALQCGDAELAADTLREHASALAGEPETDALVERVAALAMQARPRFDLWSARAELARTRGAIEREQQAHERALQLATESADPLLLGRAYSALGRFHESRDADRAFACYEDSARYLLAADPEHSDAATVAQYMTTLVRLAWMHVLRSHPQAVAMLQRAENLRSTRTVPDALAGMLEQTWGEYWRIAGDPQRALQAKHRALNIFERLGDQRSVLVTCLNLITLHGEARQLDKAESYARQVFAVASRTPVDPSILVSTHVNLGLAYGWSNRHDQSIDEHRQALRIAMDANLRLHANRARLNLANAHYRRYAETGDSEHERRGDDEVDALLRTPAAERVPTLTEAARNLKSEVLGAREERLVDRLLTDESAAHLDEMSEIQRQRDLLLKTDAPEAQVRSRLAIANAYMAISVKEREAARQLIERHGLGERFASELGQLRETFDRNLTAEQRLMAHYKQQAADLLDDARRAALVERLLRDGAINKSGYAELCGVSPATASKHLAALAERGLLLQTGKGPSTRYQLPAS